MLQMFRFRLAVQSDIYGFKNAVDVSGNIVVPKAKHAVALRLKPTGPCFIADNIVFIAVLRTVYLDNEVGCHARDIDDICADRDLSSKMAAERRQAA